MKNGYYRFTSERSLTKGIAQKIGNEWHLIGETKPVTEAELNRRGWKVDTIVEDMDME